MQDGVTPPSLVLLLSGVAGCTQESEDHSEDAFSGAHIPTRCNRSSSATPDTSDKVAREHGEAW
jgi:hypothetical protein